MATVKTMEKPRHTSKAATPALDWLAAVTQHDSFRCPYVQPLDPKAKVPRGDPVAVTHGHSLRRYPVSGGTLAVGSGRLAITLKDQQLTSGRPIYRINTLTTRS